MFSKKERQIYQQITAPDELRSRVLAEAGARRQSRKTGLRVLSAAACLLLICSSVFLLHRSARSVITVNGQKLSEQGVVLPEAKARTANTAADSSRIIPLDLQLKRETEISADAGTITAAEDETLSAPCTALTAEGTVALYWKIDADATACKMTLRNEKESYVLFLSYDRTADQWLIHCTEE